MERSMCKEKVRDPISDQMDWIYEKNLSM